MYSRFSGLLDDAGVGSSSEVEQFAAYCRTASASSSDTTARVGGFIILCFWRGLFVRRWVFRNCVQCLVPGYELGPWTTIEFCCGHSTHSGGSGMGAAAPRAMFLYGRQPSAGLHAILRCAQVTGRYHCGFSEWCPCNIHSSFGRLSCAALVSMVDFMLCRVSSPTMCSP